VEGIASHFVSLKGNESKVLGTIGRENSVILK
jgi:hypothetical protein